MATGQQDPDPPVMSQRAPRNHTPSMLSTLAAAGRANGPRAPSTAITCLRCDLVRGVGCRHEREGRARSPSPAAQKVHGYSNIAPRAQRRRQPGDPPPVLRCPARARQGVGGEHMAHQVVRAPTSTQRCPADWPALQRSTRRGSPEHQEPVAGLRATTSRAPPPPAMITPTHC